jgi:hypothetical protein
LRDGLNVDQLEDRRARVPFDVDGSGQGRRWSWITKDAGWIVYDPHNTGRITSGLQLFGNVTFWMFWDNGYQALGALDDNHDGILSGKELIGLGIWHDRNGNGICDPGEVQPLSALGVVALSLKYQIDEQRPDRIDWVPNGVVFANGRARPSYDFLLHAAPASGETQAPGDAWIRADIFGDQFSPGALARMGTVRLGNR